MARLHAAGTLQALGRVDRLPSASEEYTPFG
jgi:hypothetical protein